MPSKARTNFDKNKADITRLWTIHQGVAGKGAGFKKDVEVLNRAAIVFITACWESFVEDLAREAFDQLLANAPSASVIPSKVQNFATKPIFSQQDSRKVWDLADSGWRTVLAAHRDETLLNWMGTFHTPKTANVNTLYDSLLGLGKLSNAWKWQRMSSTAAGKKLDDYITIRGNIAHRVHHDEDVYKDWSTDYLAHIERLVQLSETETYNHLKSVTTIAPW